MKITKDLKLAFRVDSEERGELLVYSASISRDTFEIYFAELGRVFMSCFGGDDEGRHLALVGPQTAYAALKAAAIDLGTWDTPSGVQNGLVNEIIRMTQVAHADGAGGWKLLPMATASAHGILDEDAREEVLNSIVFFTAACKAGPRRLVQTLLPLVSESLDWEIGSWASFSEYVDSLPKSTPPATSTMPLQSVIA